MHVVEHVLATWLPGSVEALFPAFLAALLVGDSPLTGSLTVLGLVGVCAALARLTIRPHRARAALDPASSSRSLTIRRHADAAPVPALCDPDARGKPRPRAPGAVAAAG